MRFTHREPRLRAACAFRRCPVLQHVSMPRFSLGAAIIPGCEPAPDCVGPADPVPQSWLELFIQHACGEVWGGLLTTCRPGRDWVLQNAPYADLVLDCTVDQPQAAWDQQLRSVRGALITRAESDSRVSTHLTVVFNETADSTLALGRVPAVLTGAHISALFVDCPEELSLLRSATLTAFLHAVSVALPTLATLHLPTPPLLFPPAEQLTQLVNVTVQLPPLHQVQAAGLSCDLLFQSLSPLLPQLGKLDLRPATPAQGAEAGGEQGGLIGLTYPWDHLLQNIHTSYTLTHFSAHTALTDGLVRLICTHAPLLSHLTVHSVVLWREPDEDGEMEGVGEWGVSTLRVTGRVSVMDLAWLPRSVTEAGSVQLVVEVGCERREGVTSIELNVTSEEVRMGYGGHTYTHVHTRTMLTMQALQRA